MSSGPIEFLGDGEDRSVPVSEYGGGDGLIQGDSGVLARGDGMPLRHELSASEIRDVMTRAASEPLGVEVTARNEAEVASLYEDIIDPATGRALEPDDRNIDVTGVRGSHGLADGTWQ